MFLTRTVHIGLLTLLLVQVSLESQISKQPTLAITGVTVIDVEAGRERADQIVIVVDNRIATIGDSSATPMPAGARQIDGRGKFIIPGLIDTSYSSRQRRRSRSTARDWAPAGARRYRHS